MARRAARDDTTAGGRRPRRLGAWTDPWWRDPAFWIAVAITVVLIVLMAVLTPGDRTSPVNLARLALLSLVAWLVVSACIRIRLGMTRGLVQGFTEVQEKAAASPSGMTTGEQVARGAGKAVGKAVGAWKRTRGTSRSR